MEKGKRKNGSPTYPGSRNSPLIAGRIGYASA
jgi:hypothetical protein